LLRDAAQIHGPPRARVSHRREQQCETGSDATGACCKYTYKKAEVKMPVIFSREIKTFDENVK